MMVYVSIPNGKSGPLRHCELLSINQAGWKFQSQTGSQALSDADTLAGRYGHPDVSIPNGKSGPLRRFPLLWGNSSTVGFNPKREVRHSQTNENNNADKDENAFQSQTGSQALSDATAVCAHRRI